MPPAPRSFSLECHPQLVPPSVRSLQVQLSSASSGLRLKYILDGHIARLRIPDPATSERVDELWRHTCFEAFLAVGDAPAYFEFNFSPSSQWALYRFDAYREGLSAIPIAQAPQIAVRRGDYRLELDAQVPLQEISELRDGDTIRLALAAVVESDDGGISYWALRHAPDKPDFHHAAGFIAKIVPGVLQTIAPAEPS